MTDGVGFSKEQLLESLRRMKRTPETIPTTSAMCYETVELPDDVTFHCQECGHDMLYSRKTDEGGLTDDYLFLIRILDDMLYITSIDATGLCDNCRGEKKKSLILHFSCFNCGKDYVWEAFNTREIKTEWFRLKHPIQEIDLGQVHSVRNKEEYIRDGAEYLINHVYCPKCRVKILADIKSTYKSRFLVFHDIWGALRDLIK